MCKQTLLVVNQVNKGPPETNENLINVPGDYEEKGKMFVSSWKKSEIARIILKALSN